MPDAAVFTQVYNDNTQQSQFTTGANTLTTGGLSATSIANLQPSPNESASASVNGSGQATAYSQLTYYFAIEGASGVQVPIIITASGEVTQGSVESNTAQLYFGGPSGTQLIASACQGDGATAQTCSPLALQPSFSIATSELITSNTPYSIGMDLQVVANTSATERAADSGSDFIDPIITIDPTFALADQFQLEFSPGVGNTPAAPVPEMSNMAKLAVLLLAFIGLAVTRCREGVQG